MRGRESALQPPRGLTSLDLLAKASCSPCVPYLRNLMSMGLRSHATDRERAQWPPVQPHAGKYIDKKCPFTGNVSIRGRIMTGVVKSTKMTRTIIVKR